MFSELSIFSPWRDEACGRNLQPLLTQKMICRSLPVLMFMFSLFLDPLMDFFGRSSLRESSQKDILYLGLY